MDNFLIRLKDDVKRLKDRWQIPNGGTQRFAVILSDLIAYDKQKPTIEGCLALMSDVQRDLAAIGAYGVPDDCKARFEAVQSEVDELVKAGKQHPWFSPLVAAPAPSQSSYRRTASGSSQRRSSTRRRAAPAPNPPKPPPKRKAASKPRAKKQPPKKKKRAAAAVVDEDDEEESDEYVPSDDDEFEEEEKETDVQRNARIDRKSGYVKEDDFLADSEEIPTVYNKKEYQRLAAKEKAARAKAEEEKQQAQAEADEDEGDEDEEEKDPWQAYFDKASKGKTILPLDPPPTLPGKPLCSSPRGRERALAAIRNAQPTTIELLRFPKNQWHTHPMYRQIWAKIKKATECGYSRDQLCYVLYELASNGRLDVVIARESAQEMLDRHGTCQICGIRDRTAADRQLAVYAEDGETIIKQFAIGCFCLAKWEAVIQFYAIVNHRTLTQHTEGALHKAAETCLTSCQWHTDKKADNGMDI